MSRPWEKGIDTKEQFCPRCEKTTQYRRHKGGVKANGRQHYRWRCTECHNNYNKSRGVKNAETAQDQGGPVTADVSLVPGGVRQT